jgi:hypothetical protein
MDIEVGVARGNLARGNLAMTSHIGNGRAAPRLVRGLLVGAALFAAAPAQADDSLWGKAMGAIGIGGASQPDPAAQPAAVPAPAPQAAPAAPQAKPTAQGKAAGQAKPAAAEAAAVPSPPAMSVTSAPAPAPEQGGNIFSNWFGLGRSGGPSESSAPSVSSSSSGTSGSSQRAVSPVAAPPPPPPAPRPTEASMWDKMLGSVGVGNGGTPMDSINYNERPKLSVPKDRALAPAPQATSEPAATRGANSDYLIKPPGEYLEKVKGADGTASGLRDVDVGKDKKLFGLF